MSDFVQVDDPDVNDIVIHAAGEPSDFYKSCVNYGLITGNYCDGGEYNAAAVRVSLLVPLTVFGFCAKAAWAVYANLDHH